MLQVVHMVLPFPTASCLIHDKILIFYSLKDDGSVLSPDHYITPCSLHLLILGSNCMPTHAFKTNYDYEHSWFRYDRTKKGWCEWLDSHYPLSLISFVLPLSCAEFPVYPPHFTVCFIVCLSSYHYCPSSLGSCQSSSPLVASWLTVLLSIFQGTSSSAVSSHLHLFLSQCLTQSLPSSLQ